MNLQKTTITLFVLATLLFAVVSVSHAAPVSFTLNRTSPLYNEDPPGAPVPLGRTQYDAGELLGLRGNKIGEYLRVKDVHDGTLNYAAVTITLFFEDPDAEFPLSITLQGVHSFDNGNQQGSISASGIPGISGITFTFTSSSNTLTLNVP